MNLPSPDCPSAVQLELFLLEGEKSGLGWVEEHLEKCAYCRMQATMRRADFASYAQALSERPVAQPGCILLSKQLRGSGGIPIESRLAAQGRAASTEGNSLTLVSSDQRFVMKLVRDQHSGEAWIYLLADDQTDCRHALIYPFGMEQGYVTDSEGRANLGRIDWPGDEQATAELRLPAANFILSPPETYRFGEPQVIESADGDLVKIMYQADGEQRRLEIQLIDVRGIGKDAPLRLAVCEQHSTRLHILSPGLSPTAKIEGVQGAIELYLYQ